MRECLKGQACKTFSQPSTMSSSDSESTCSDLTDASEKSDVGSPVIQNLDIIMVTDATVGSGDDETNAVGKTVQMTAKNSSKTDAEGNSTQMTTPKSSRMDPDGKTTQMIATNSLSASASTAQILATNSSSASASTADRPSSASASTAQILATNSSSASVSFLSMPYQ